VEVKESGENGKFPIYGASFVRGEKTTYSLIDNLKIRFI
jgi:hypothetical protein